MRAQSITPRPAHRIALALFVALNLADTVTTHVGLAAGLSEANGLPALAYAQGGEIGLFGVKWAACALVALVVIRLTRYPGLWRAIHVGSGLLALVVVSNIWQIAP